MILPNHSLTSTAALEMLVSDRVGLIRHVGPIRKVIEEPRLPLFYRAMLGSIPKSSRRWAGVGKGFTESEALTGAVAEALERYCALCPDELIIKRSTLAELGNQAIDPREFVLYSPQQYDLPGFPYLRFDRHREIAWRAATELPHGIVYDVPSSLVYLKQSSKSVGDCLTTATSNGLAAGEDFNSAVLGGILELIERDSFLINWMNCLPVDKLELTELGVEETSILDHYSQQNIDVKIYVLQTDIPAHVMMAISRDGNGRPPVTAIGLGCSLNPLEAIRKAIFELCQVRHGEYWRYRYTDGYRHLKSPSDIRRPDDHSGFYASRDVPQAFTFLNNGEIRSIRNLTSFSTGTAYGDVTHCVNHLRKLGLRVFCVDLTTPDIREIKISVAKVLVTSLQPLHFGYGMERNGGNRLHNVVNNFGFRTQQEPRLCFNEFPHPLG